jgi:hypothetical protein
MDNRLDIETDIFPLSVLVVKRNTVRGQLLEGRYDIGFTATRDT